MAKICVITGGASGIGAATAKALRREGWEVIVTGVTEAELAAVPGSVPLDVRDAGAVAALFGGIERLDGLVNSAGVGAIGDPMELDVFETTLDINLTGTFRCCRSAHPALVAAGGAVVNVASVLGYAGNAQAPAYCASKAGVVNLTRALGARWAADGVRVNAVAPGYIETPMTDHVRGDDDRRAAVLGRTRMNRFGTPDEVAEMIAFLLSDRAAFITGSTHAVDGGYLAT